MKPNETNPLLLPSLPLARRRYLPNLPCCYFVVSGNDEIVYIGASTLLRQRWMHHHRMRQFLELENVRIAWLYLEDAAILNETEKALIAFFKPTFNNSRIENRRFLRVEVLFSDEEFEEMRRKARGMSSCNYFRQLVGLPTLKRGAVARKKVKVKA